MKKTSVFNISIFLIFISLLVNLTGCKWITIGGDFAEIVNESLESKVTYFEDNPKVIENPLKIERTYKIGSRYANLEAEDSELEEFKTNHIGYKLLGWKYLCNALDTSITTLPEGIELDENGCIIALTIPVDPFWVYAVWIEADDTPYKVNHWIQNSTLDDYEIYKEENLTGTTNKNTAAKALEIDGFEAKAFEQTKIDAHGTSEINIYYDRKKINITVIINGSSKNYAGYYGQSLTSEDYDLSKVTPDGYVFDKWLIKYEDDTEGESLNEYIFYSKDNAIYTAIWKEKTYTVSYVLQGEGEVTVSNAAWSSEFTPVTERSTKNDLVLPTASNLLRSGYDFVGWYEDSAYTTPINNIAAGIAKDITVYAKWNPITYTITYELNGGNWVTGFTAETSITIEQNLTLPLAASLVKDGYNFTGWCSDSGLTNNISEITTGTSSNITVYAAWRVAGAHAGSIAISVPVYSDAVFIFGDNLLDYNNLNNSWRLKISINSIKLDENDFVLSNMTINWYLDGSILQSNTSSIDEQITTPGYHLLTIVATDNTTGESYSFSSEVRITY